MMRKFPWLVFALVVGWKIVLFIFSAQPVPANDAFFYDGAVIHHLLHGGYFNPCVAKGFPISGTKIFSAYPPLYQAPLLGWMSIFGVSALSAMGLHLFLFAMYLLVLLAIFRRLQTPAWCVNVAGLFLFGLTFHDRPDSFAHLMGVLAVYSCLRSRKILDPAGSGNRAVWAWRMSLFIILAFCTSLQIGGIYLLVVSIATVASCRLEKEPLPLLPMSLMVLTPIALVFLVQIFLPKAWAGFMENVRQTPFITGVRMPQVLEFLKMGRTVPGVLLVTVLLTWSWFKQTRDTESGAVRHEIMLLAALLPALGIMVASLTIISANTFAIANYLQPIIVASYLAFGELVQAGRRWPRSQTACLVFAILLACVRAIGMSTWGVACAADVSYKTANERVEQELSNHPPGYKVIMSSAFLYGATNHYDLDLIHSDWMTRAKGDSRVSDSRALIALKPGKMILTQFDYYRRFQAVLDRVKGDPSLKEIQVINLAHTPPPDSIKPLQQVVQHISWAPVIVNLTWRQP